MRTAAPAVSEQQPQNEVSSYSLRELCLAEKRRGENSDAVYSKNTKIFHTGEPGTQQLTRGVKTMTDKRPLKHRGINTQGLTRDR